MAGRPQGTATGLPEKRGHYMTVRKAGERRLPCRKNSHRRDVPGARSGTCVWTPSFRVSHKNGRQKGVISSIDLSDNGKVLVTKTLQKGPSESAHSGRWKPRLTPLRKTGGSLLA